LMGSEGGKRDVGGGENLVSLTRRRNWGGRKYDEKDKGSKRGEREKTGGKKMTFNQTGLRRVCAPKEKKIFSATTTAMKGGNGGKGGESHEQVPSGGVTNPVGTRNAGRRKGWEKKATICCGHEEDKA